MTLSDWFWVVQTFWSAKLTGFIQQFLDGRNQHCSNLFDILSLQANQIDLKYIKIELAIMTIHQILTRVRSEQIPLFRLDNSQKSLLWIACVFTIGTNSTKKLSINGSALNTF